MGLLPTHQPPPVKGGKEPMDRAARAGGPPRGAARPGRAGRAARPDAPPPAGLPGRLGGRRAHPGPPALDLVGFGIILPILPIYGERLGASPTTLGFVVSSFSVAQLIFSPLLGRLSDRIGRRPVILLSLFGTAVGSVITGGATSVWMLF